MRIIITGITSFIGRETATALLRAGHRVTGIVRPESRNVQRLEGLEGLELVRLDFDALPEAAGTAPGEEENPAWDIRAHLGGTAGADVWIHFAWDGVGSAGRSDPAIQTRNLANAKKAYRMAETLGCHRFLFAGSQAEYGTGTKQQPAPVSEYGKAKLAFGSWALQQSYTKSGPEGMTFVHMRIYSVYGVGDHETSLVNTCIDAFLKGEEMRMGPCTQLWNYMEVRDCAAAICCLACGPEVRGGVYDLAGKETRPLKEYVEEIFALCGGRGRCSFGVRQNNAEGAGDLCPDTSALQALGFSEGISFQEGIRHLIAYRKSKMDL